MKRFAAVLAMLLTAITAGYAQTKGMESGGMAQGQSHKGTAVVKAVNRTAGKVTLAHGPIRSMDWPAMTMTFSVKDKAMLDKLSLEQKIEFEFVKQGSGHVISSIK